MKHAELVVDDLIGGEVRLCMGCDDRTCISCKAKAMNASPKATAIFIYRDENSNITNIEEVWIH